jgi:hypothetical protein
MALPQCNQLPRPAKKKWDSSLRLDMTPPSYKRNPDHRQVELKSARKTRFDQQTTAPEAHTV